jgi:tripartite-type tricarboxylate transporter receptor subunit TctC
MRMNRRHFMAGAATMLAAPAALADPTWPNRPVRLVIPFPPGGGTDICGRILGAKLGEIIGQPVVIDNRGGAGGMIGTRAVGQSPADGYTLLFNGTASIVRDGFDPRSAVHHVARAAITHNILVVNQTVPVSNVPEFIAYVKARPGQLNHGTAGPLTSQHLSAVMFDLLAGTKMENVHYRGTGPSVAGILGNEVQVMFASLSAVLALVQEGQAEGVRDGVLTQIHRPAAAAHDERVPAGLRIRADLFLLHPARHAGGDRATACGSGAAHPGG